VVVLGGIAVVVVLGSGTVVEVEEVELVEFTTEVVVVVDVS
jgi:hypothetical protein